MFRTILWFAYFWISLLGYIPLSCYICILQAQGRNERATQYAVTYARKWAQRLLRIAGCKVIVQGQEHVPQEAAVYISNHQGNFDVPIMLAYVGSVRGLVAKKELARLPFLHTWMRHLHCILVDRSSARAGAQSIVDAVHMLASGYALTIFPEGTRSRGGAMHPFKQGAFLMATKAGVPIVPVTIDGSYRMMEANRGLRITPATVRVTIHPPIATAGLDRQQRKDLAKDVQEVIAQALADPAQREIQAGE